MIGLLTLMLCFWSFARGGYPEHGVSIFPDGDKEYDGGSWNVVSGWTYQNTDGHYVAAIKVHESTSKFIVQKNGVYYITFYISLVSGDESITIGTVINGDRTAGMPIYSTGYASSDISASAFLKLQAFDDISLVAMSNNSFVVSEKSYIGIHYQGDPLEETAFSLSLRSDVQLKPQTNVVNAWTRSTSGQFSTWSVFEFGELTFQTPYHGIYLLSANLIFRVLEGVPSVVIRVLVDDKEIICVYCTYGFPIVTPQWTTHVNDIIHIRAFSTIKLIVMNVQRDAQIMLTSMSTYSVALTKAPQRLGSGFHAFLWNERSFTVNNDGMFISPWVPKANKTTDFKMLLPSAELVEKRYFNNLEGEEVFYVSCQLVFQIAVYGSRIYENSTLTFAFQKDSNSLYLEKTIKPYSSTFLGNDSTSIGKISSVMYSVHLAGVFQLSRYQPLGVYIKSNHHAFLTFHPRSTFSVVRTTTNYPGVHSSLQGFPQAIETGEPYEIQGWKSKGYYGLYDLLGSSHERNSSFVATLPGIYFATGNAIVGDVDNNKRLSAFISYNARKIVRYKESAPLQTTTVIVGGLFDMLSDDELHFNVWALDDMEWRIITGGFSVNYIGMQPEYFLSVKDTNQVITENAREAKTLIEFPHNRLKNKVFTVRQTGIYLTTVAVVLNMDDYVESTQAEYKVYVALDGVEIEGLYAKRKTPYRTVEKPMTLFISGSFYAEKGMQVSVYAQSDIKHSFLVTEFSSWSLVYVASQSLTSGALATIYEVAVFQEGATASTTVGDWRFTDVKVGSYVTYGDSLYFTERQITVIKGGLYTISVNLEVAYSKWDEQTAFKLSAVINEDEVVQNMQNGMTSWQKSSYPTQTLHICGTMFLHSGDRFSLQITSSQLDKLTIKKPSSLSIVMIPEPVQYPSFVSRLKENVGLSGENPSLPGWQFNSGISSRTFNKETGETNTPFTGYYTLRLSLPFLNLGSNVKKATINVHVNDKIASSYSVDLWFKNGTLDINDILYLQSGDVVSFPLFLKFEVDNNNNNNDNNNNNNKNNSSYNNTDVTPDHEKLFIKAVGSVFSLVYMPYASNVTGWIGNFEEDVNIEENGESTPLSPWKAPVHRSGMFEINENGLYILSNTINIKHIVGSVEVSFHSDGKSICSSLHDCLSDCETSFRLNCYVNLTKSDRVIMYILTSRPGVIVTKGSKRMINKMAPTVQGFNVGLLSSSIVDSREWKPVGNWSRDAKEYGLFAESVLQILNSFICKEPGTYQVSANIQIMMIDSRNCSRSCRSIRSQSVRRNVMVEVGISINDVIDSTMHKTIYVDGNVNTTTVSVVGSIALKKWDKIAVEVKSTLGTKVKLLEGSTWSAVFLAPPPYSLFDNPGPVIVYKLSPNYISTSVIGIKRTWYCRAVGERPIIYRWYKDGELLLTQNGTTGVLTIDGEVDDSAMYQCTASIGTFRTFSSRAIFNITDIEECELGTHKCSSDAKCTNTFGSYICTCQDGYEGGGRRCIDTDECTDQSHDCNALFANCVNTNGSYYCVCKTGWTGTNGHDCKDENECELDKNVCHDQNATCTNTRGGYNCTCKHGFRKYDGKCYDVNECREGTSVCHIDAICIDLVGSYKCSCKHGYRGDGTNCTDMNECVEMNHNETKCDKMAICSNMDGGYNCTCKHGYEGNGTTCSDINECRFNSTCDVNAYCTNLNGAYNCTCKHGFVGPGSSCTDFNECIPGLNETTGLPIRYDLNCSHVHRCLNRMGGYDCACKEGFIENDNSTCQDIDECMNSPCALNAECENTVGSYMCQCRYGWRGDGFHLCKDIDECFETPKICGRGNCTNYGGGHLCVCDQDYRQNGLTCALIQGPKSAGLVDECAVDKRSFKCLCYSANKREHNILCNGLFVALFILVLLAIVILAFVGKYIKARKMRRINPVKTHRDKYVEIEGVTEL